MFGRKKQPQMPAGAIAAATGYNGQVIVYPDRFVIAQPGQRGDPAVWGKTIPAHAVQEVELRQHLRGGGRPSRKHTGYLRLGLTGSASDALNTPDWAIRHRRERERRDDPHTVWFTDKDAAQFARVKQAADHVITTRASRSDTTRASDPTS